MAKYMCQCGMFLVKQKLKKEHKNPETSKNIHCKVLIVQTTTRLVCPKGCELKDVAQFNKK